jgi:TolA-binding protein
MPDKFTVLIERALNSDSDREKLYCIQQAKRIKRSGVIKVSDPKPRQVAPQPEPSITTQQHDNAVDTLTKKVRDLESNAIQLQSENQTLLDKIQTLELEVIQYQTQNVKHKQRKLIFGFTCLAAISIAVLGIGLYMGILI